MEGGLTTSQITNCTLSTFGILGNTLTILVFARDKKLLKKSHNVFILCLAIADVLTSILLLTSPVMGLGDFIPRPTNRVLGEIFCRVFWSRVFIFQLVFFSVYITLLLTIERWVAVLKPSKYHMAFKGKRVAGYIMICWIWSFILNGTGLLDANYEPNSSSNDICVFRFISSGSFFRTSKSVFIMFFKMFFPSLSMIGLYVHMIVATNNSPVTSAASKAKLRGKMTRMVGIMTFILLVCFSPNQFFYTVVVAGKEQVDSPLHHLTAFLLFTTICVNPFIYGISNSNYRQRYKKLLFSVCFKRFSEDANAALSPVRIEPARSEQPAINVENITDSQT